MSIYILISNQLLKLVSVQQVIRWKHCHNHFVSWFHECKMDIFCSSKYFYFILKSLGLAHYQFDKKSRSFKTSLSNFLGLIVSIAIWPILFLVSLRMNQKYNYDSGVKLELLDEIWKFQYLLQHILPIFTIIFNFYKRKSIENFMNQIFKFDQKTQQLGWNTKTIHSSILVLVFYLLSAFAIVLHQFIVICFLKVYGDFGSFIDEIYKIVAVLAYVIITEFYLMVSLQFILSSHCVNVRLKLLIKHIR